MAVNAYLVIQGVNGPSKSMNNAIDITSYNFGATMPTVTGVGSSGAESRAGRANIDHVSITKKADATTPHLFGHCTIGTIIPKVSVYYAQSSGTAGSAPVNFYEVNLTNAMITGFHNSGSGENVDENITFYFQKIQIGYNPESASGSQGGMILKGYDLHTLKGS